MQNIEHPVLENAVAAFIKGYSNDGLLSDDELKFRGIEYLKDYFPNCWYYSFFWGFPDYNCSDRYPLLVVSKESGKVIFISFDIDNLTEMEVLNYDGLGLDMLDPHYLNTIQIMLN